MIAVGTPQDNSGSADLSSVFDVVHEIAHVMNGYKVLVTKSTVPVGTADKIREILAEKTTHPFAVVSNPEFLKQGAAVDDFLKPDRVVVGTDDDRAAEMMRELYAPFLRTGNPVIFMDIRSAEMTKYVANAFLATRFPLSTKSPIFASGSGRISARFGWASPAIPGLAPSFSFPAWDTADPAFPKT